MESMAASPCCVELSSTSEGWTSPFTELITMLVTSVTNFELRTLPVTQCFLPPPKHTNTQQHKLTPKWEESRTEDRTEKHGEPGIDKWRPMRILRL